MIQVASLGLSGLSTDEKPARKGFAEVGRIIHSVRWEHHFNQAVMLAKAFTQSSSSFAQPSHPRSAVTDVRGSEISVSRLMAQPKSIWIGGVRGVLPSAW